MQLVEQHEDQRHCASQNLEVETRDHDLGLGDKILDRLVVIARLEATFQIGQFLDHADRLLIGTIGNRLRLAEKQRRGARPEIHQHRDQHQRGRVCRLGRALGHQRKKVTDHPLLRDRVPRSEHSSDEIAEPLAGRITEPRIAGNVR
ncbi:hypothetical protein [Bradyrhizobium sp. BR 1433]|uniref:hypothetical protein n=1 Tax=Bradyrhizobium sp. BR 1433 TaxID=3447967 RepID=UPI003EE65A64